MASVVAIVVRDGDQHWPMSDSVHTHGLMLVLTGAHGPRGLLCLGADLVWMKELRQVKISSGTMAHSVITLLNFDSRILRVSDEAASVMLAVWLRDRSWSFSLLVKYWAQRKTHD